ncbi:MAG: hypothetical protein ACKVWR_13695 [Acidimicrobiales bacterium]
MNGTVGSITGGAGGAALVERLAQLAARSWTIDELPALVESPELTVVLEAFPADGGGHDVVVTTRPALLDAPIWARSSGGRTPAAPARRAGQYRLRGLLGDGFELGVGAGAAVALAPAPRTRPEGAEVVELSRFVTMQRTLAAAAALGERTVTVTCESDDGSLRAELAEEDGRLVLSVTTTEAVAEPMAARVRWAVVSPEGVGAVESLTAALAPRRAPAPAAARYVLGDLSGVAAVRLAPAEPVALGALSGEEVAEAFRYELHGSAARSWRALGELAACPPGVRAAIDAALG